MLKEAIEKIVSLAATNSRAAIMPHPADPRKVFVDQAGVVQAYDIAPPLRQHRVTTLADLIAFAKRAKNPVAWHHHDAVRLVLDDDDRRETVIFALNHSETFQRLRTIANKPDEQSFTPKELANFLRVQLAAAEVPETVIAGLRKLRWEQKQIVQTELSRTRESIGRDVEAELTATVELPESIQVKTTVYRDVGEDHEYFINCLIDPRPFDQQIAFVPIPGELDGAVDLAQADIRARLEQYLPQGTAVFAGVPQSHADER